jgi:hypothetical protein
VATICGGSWSLSATAPALHSGTTLTAALSPGVLPAGRSALTFSSNSSRASRLGASSVGMPCDLSGNAWSRNTQRRSVSKRRVGRQRALALDPSPFESGPAKGSAYGPGHTRCLQGDLAQRAGGWILETYEVQSVDTGLLAESIGPATCIGDGLEAFDDLIQTGRVAGRKNNCLKGKHNPPAKRTPSERIS